VRKILSSFGGLVGGVDNFSFPFPKQGRAYDLKKVAFAFNSDGTISADTYFRLIHRNGEGEIVEMVSTTTLETIDDGFVNFMQGDVEFRSHIDSSLSQIVTAPLGCEGWRIESNDTLEIQFQSVAILAQDFTVGQLYWHCDFDEKAD